MVKQIRPSKQFTVVAYDIADDQRRQKLAKLLEKHGTRVNYSVFECFLRPSELEKLKQKINSLTHAGTDSVLFYTLCLSCLAQRQQLGCYNNVPPMILKV